MRTISSAVLTQLSAETMMPALMVEAQFNTSSVYLWTGYGDVTFNGQTYQGAGTLLEITPFEESDEIVAKGARFSFSGIPTAMISLALGQISIKNQVKCWLNFVDPSAGTLVATSGGDAVLIYEGFMDVPEIFQGPETSRIVISTENKLRELKRSKELKYTDEQQKLLYPGDKGLEYVSQVQDMEITWGRGVI